MGPQTDNAAIDLVNELILSGPLADSETAVIIDQALRYLSGDLLPAIETMLAGNMNATQTAMGALNLIQLTGERGARAVTSYAEKTTDSNTLEGNLATAHSAFCATKLAAAAGVELTKIVDAVLVQIGLGSSIDFGSLIYDAILPISKLSSDIMAYQTEGQCYVLEEYA